MIVFSFNANDTVQQKPKHGPPSLVHFRCSHVGLTQVTPPGPRKPTPQMDEIDKLWFKPESHPTKFHPTFTSSQGKT